MVILESDDLYTRCCLLIGCQEVEEALYHVDLSIQGLGMEMTSLPKPLRPIMEYTYGK